METGKINSTCLMVATVLIVLMEFALGWAVSTWPGSQWPLLATTRLMETVACLAAVAWFADLDLLGLGTGRLRPAILQAILWVAIFAAAGILIYVSARLLAGIDLLPAVRAGIPATLPDRLWLFFVGGVIGPVAEECFFRGIIYGYLRRWGILAAVCGSTAVFVGLHSIGGFPFNQLVGGVVFALAFEKSGSLATPVIIHVSGNLAIFSISLMIPA